MDNYKTIRSVLLQLQIIGNGKYDDAVMAIQSALPEDEPYTATNENVLYAKAVLNDILQKEGKSGSRRIGKYIKKFPERFDTTDEADDFINELKFNVTPVVPLVHMSPTVEPERFEGIL